jgi:ketosteroid isomerase-like protein
MKKIFVLSVIVLTVQLSYAQSNLHEAIASSNNIYFQSFVKNDSSIFIDRYTEDCLIMIPNAPAMKGHAGALAFFKTAYNSIGLRNGKFITTAIYGLDDDYAVEEGLWQSFDNQHKLFDNGKFLVLWKKTDKGWKMFRDSFSSDNSVNSQHGI